MPNHGRQLVQAVAGALGYTAFCVFSSAGLPAVARAQTAPCSITLAWDANTEPDLASYRLSWGLMSGSYTTSVTIAAGITRRALDLPSGKVYYFVVQATNSAGVTSGNSNEVRADLTTCPTSGTVYRIPRKLVGPVMGTVVKG